MLLARRKKQEKRILVVPSPTCPRRSGHERVIVNVVVRGSMEEAEALVQADGEEGLTEEYRTLRDRIEQARIFINSEAEDKEMNDLLSSI